MEMGDYIRFHIAWSQRTFGDGERTEGLLKHIAKEVEEVRQTPQDLTEWVDIIILAIDGAWRNCNASAEDIARCLEAKQVVNRWRQWPPVEELSDDQPAEHVR